jgi:hypothetical protein
VEDLVILTRVFDLLAWLIPKAESFPRTFRSTVTHRLLHSALDLGEALTEAQVRRGPLRARQLELSDAKLDQLRMYLRLAHQWRWLSDGQYEHVSRMVAEIGKLLGGWKKRNGVDRERGG